MAIFPASTSFFKSKKLKRLHCKMKIMHNSQSWEWNLVEGKKNDRVKLIKIEQFTSRNAMIKEFNYTYKSQELCFMQIIIYIATHTINLQDIRTTVHISCSRWHIVIDASIVRID